MKTIKEGDRVNHPSLGAGTVIEPSSDLGWAFVDFDGIGKAMCNAGLLSLVPEPTPKPSKFKITKEPMNEFEDIRKGDLVRITNAVGDTISTVTGIASHRTEGLSNDYWLTEQGVMLLTRLERGTVEIINQPEG